MSMLESHFSENVLIYILISVKWDLVCDFNLRGYIVLIIRCCAFFFSSDRFSPNTKRVNNETDSSSRWLNYIRRFYISNLYLKCIYNLSCIQLV